MSEVEDESVMQCQTCQHRTMWLEARLRKCWTGRCGHCEGGTLLPIHWPKTTEISEPAPARRLGAAVGIICIAWLGLSGCCAQMHGYSPLCVFGTDIGAPDYGAREMPKQPRGMSDDDYWKMLNREGWF